MLSKQSFSNHHQPYGNRNTGWWSTTHSIRSIIKNSNHSSWLPSELHTYIFIYTRFDVTKLDLGVTKSGHIILDSRVTRVYVALRKWGFGTPAQLMPFFFSVACPSASSLSFVILKVDRGNATAVTFTATKILKYLEQIKTKLWKQGINLGENTKKLIYIYPPTLMMMYIVQWTNKQHTLYRSLAHLYKSISKKTSKWIYMHLQIRRNDLNNHHSVI